MVGEDVEPVGYAEVLARLTDEVRSAQTRAQRVVNTELLGLYWTIGRAILDRQAAEGWGTRVIDRLAEDLRAEFPGMRGFSGRNLRYMAAAARAWPDAIGQQAVAQSGTQVGQQPVAQLPWGHTTVLLDKIDDQAERDWYAAKAVDNGWSRNVLLNQIVGRLHLREGAAPTNFAAQLPSGESELAQQLTKDPYVFDFLNVSERALERDVEQALMDRLQETLLELGRGFAFVGRQVRFDVEGENFFADLVFFHVEQLRYVVLELKIGRFKPDYAGQLGFYVAVVDDQLRNPAIHSPTVGILLCASRNDAVVRYSLANTTAPMAVANYVAAPAEAAQLSLPGQTELEAILSAPFAGHPGTTLADALPDDEQ